MHDVNTISGGKEFACVSRGECKFMAAILRRRIVLTQKKYAEEGGHSLEGAQGRNLSYEFFPMLKDGND